ncbi:LysE family translocator [Aestuariibius insulae]|uniref:LysE family translocator n=1 Tax=Aestuariibius insulae TaxID=2058287 RepID=UPI00345E4D3E
MSVALTPLMVFAASQVATPGPANMILLATGARFGLRRAVPFVAGVALGKQLIIWPAGFGLLALAEQAPFVFAALKWASLAYILWLAWRIAGTRLSPGQADDAPPSFIAGLIVHPLNPKAWAMIIGIFTNFIPQGTTPLLGTAVVAAALLIVQLIFHPLWTFAGETVARVIAGRPAERWLMAALALLTLASVVYALIGSV